MSFDVPKEFGVPDEIGDMTRSLEMARHKDRYIGRLYSDFGKVPSDSGIFRSTGELREFAGEYMGLIEPCAVPPSTIVLLDNIVAVLRRSPATVEHQDRHHAVVLTELSLDTRLDRSSRDVIELNVC